MFKTTDNYYNMKTDRDRSLDIAKGIVVLTVVAGHIHIPDCFKSSIYIFHMPLFFFISGLLCSINCNRSIPEYLYHKAKSFFLPIVVCAFLFIPLKTVESYIKYGNVDTGNIFYVNFFDIPLWFLISLFFIHVLFSVYVILQRSNKITPFLYSFVLFIVGVFLARRFYLPLYLTQSFYSFVFFVVGYWFRAYRHLQNNLILFLCSISVYLLSIYNGNYMDIFSLSLRGNVFSAILGSFSGILVVLFISYYSCILFGDTKFIKSVEYCGKHSLYVFAFHWPFVTLINPLYILFDNYNIHPFIQFTVVFSLLLMLSLSIGRLLHLFLPRIIK